MRRKSRVASYVGIAILMAALIVFAALTNGFTDFNRYCLFGHDYDDAGVCTRCGQEKPADAPAVDEEGNDLASGKVHYMPKAMTFKTSANTAGVSAVADSSVTVIAQTAYSKVDYSVAWKNPTSTWATGKTVTDYVTVTQTTDGALTATVTCLQPFGEQIVLTAAARANNAVKATCTVDYKQRNKLSSIAFNSYDDFDYLDFGCENDTIAYFDLSYTSSVYTVASALPTTDYKVFLYCPEWEEVLANHNIGHLDGYVEELGYNFFNATHYRTNGSKAQYTVNITPGWFFKYGNHGYAEECPDIFAYYEQSQGKEIDAYYYFEELFRELFGSRETITLQLRFVDDYGFADVVINISQSGAFRETMSLDKNSIVF
ncbi:MAG: hypothetical protein NC350_05065 [Corallococcus sp.]|nr:hypothetical protein [Corallococcus sp.]